MLIVYKGDQEIIQHNKERIKRNVPTCVSETDSVQIGNTHLIEKYDKNKHSEYDSDIILVRLDGNLDIILPVLSFLHIIQDSYPTCKIHVEIPVWYQLLVDESKYTIKPQMSGYNTYRYYRVFNYKANNKIVNYFRQPLSIVSKKIRDHLLTIYNLEYNDDKTDLYIPPLKNCTYPDIIFVQNSITENEIVHSVKEKIGDNYTTEILQYQPTKLLELIHKIKNAKFILFFKDDPNLLFLVLFLGLNGIIFTNREYRKTDEQIYLYGNVSFVYASNIEDVSHETIANKIRGMIDEQ